MSFEVFPTNNYIPSNEEVIILSKKYLVEYLEKQNIYLDIRIKSETYFVQNNTITENNGLINDETKYESFVINGSGQALVFYHKADDMLQEFWDEEIASNIRAKALEDSINTNKNLGYSWSIKRTMGQTAIVNIYYGFLALSIANLTDGFIYSDDGAWEYTCFPSMPYDFQKQYLNISKLQDSNIKEFINKCLFELKTESENEIVEKT